MRNKIASAIEEKWPIESLTVTCEDCDSELYSVATVMPEPTGLTSNILRAIEQHHELSGHDDMDIDIYPMTPVKTIDATITINE